MTAQKATASKTAPAKAKATPKPAAAPKGAGAKGEGGFGALGNKLKNLGTQAASMKTGNGGELDWIDIDKIDIEAQQRTDTFDGDESTIDSLAGSIEEMGGLLQTILLTPRGDGRYLLVAGERRVRALIKNGETHAPCFIRVLTKEQIADAQFLENVERQKLSVLETTRALERRINDLRESGLQGLELTQALLKKYGREDTPSNRTWLSNLMALKDMGEAARNALDLTDNIQAVAAVARLETQDPAAAAQVVAEVKEKTKDAPRKAGKELIKDSQQHKDRIREEKGRPPRAKPKKDGKVAGPKIVGDDEPGAVSVALPGLAGGLAVTGEPPLSQDENGGTEPDVIIGAGEGYSPVAGIDLGHDAFELAEAGVDTTHPGIDPLSRVLRQIEVGVAPKAATESLTDDEYNEVRDFLTVFHSKGKQSGSPYLIVMAGLRRGVFGAEGLRGAQLAAFLHGSSGQRFNLLDIVGALRPVQVNPNE